MDEIRLYSATSFVGHGADEESIDRALAHRPHAIIAQGTTTDAGPYYLGTGRSIMGKEALARDLEIIIGAAQKGRIPFIVSVGGSGSNPSTQLGLQLVADICRKHGVRLKLGVVWGEVDLAWLSNRLRSGVLAKRIVPSARLEEFLSPDTVAKSTRIVGQVGPEVLVNLLREHPDLNGIVTGRALDVGLYAALPLLHGFDRGLAMHFGKIMEDGSTPFASTPEQFRQLIADEAPRWRKVVRDAEMRMN
jgi:hypothetical protein